MAIPEEILSALETAPLFHGVLQIKPLLKHLAQSQQLPLKKGDTLLSPDQPNDHVYMVLSGRLSIQASPEPQAEAIALLGEGECAGEMSVLGEHQVSAYVIAATDCSLLAIDQVAMWGLIDNSHEVAHNLLRILAGRIRGSDQIIAPSLEKHYGFSAQDMIDELTGLYNRTWMEDKFTRLLSRKAASKQACCLIVLEVDGFQEIVDSYGALGGDQVLRTLSLAMLSSLRPDDQAGHRFGAQFAIFLPNTSSLDDAYTAAERLRIAVEQAVVVLPSGDALPPANVSLGVSRSRDSDTLDDMFARASTALQQAQQGGGNRIVSVE